MSPGRKPDTLAYYDAHAAEYAEFSRPGPAWLRDLDRFCALLAPGARVLDLGCGAGHLALDMIRRGFDVSLIDGSAGLAREAEKRTGRPVRVMRFEDLADAAAYDGIWASASLLHVPGDALGNIMKRINRALVPGGVLFCSFKALEADLVDDLGRLYAAMTVPRLEAMLERAGFTPEGSVGERDGRGADGKAASFLFAYSRKVRDIQASFTWQPGGPGSPR
ncbi:SAM-dependent methyltransferase [Zhengella mangrovi]|uniref:SAM-dependent methyltransferase n=1 Tax=Zhengella mangrovi TaxID=1982044 RepID=A0A2G1QRC7_9HYPH|nr:class I SAM-dependent methyltransferase [Zhengella mangrovi]PHP68065.1 SAM-dependent methyltransferase [Zhengella mangrovi]